MSMAYVLVNCDLGKEEDIKNEIKKLDLVKEVKGTFGAYDIIVKLQSQSMEKIREMITWNIRKIDNVRSTITLVGIDKQGWKSN